MSFKDRVELTLEPKRFESVVNQIEKVLGRELSEIELTLVKKYFKEGYSVDQIISKLKAAIARKREMEKDKKDSTPDRGMW